MTTMQKAGFKAWKTRRANAQKRSNAAERAWVERRKRYGSNGIGK